MIPTPLLHARIAEIDAELAAIRARSALQLAKADRAAELDDRIAELVAEASPTTLAALGIEDRWAAA